MAAVQCTCAFASNPDQLVADRARRLDEWGGFVESLRETHVRFCALMSPSAQRLTGEGASVPLIEAAIQAMQWPDTLFTSHRCLGFPTYGDYPDSGIFRVCEREVGIQVLLGHGLKGP